MNHFATIMEKIQKNPSVTNIKQDPEMRVASFTCASGTSCSELLQPLVADGLIPRPKKINGRIKLPIDCTDNGKQAWKALLILRNENTITLAVSADKGKL